EPEPPTSLVAQPAHADDDVDRSAVPPAPAGLSMPDLGLLVKSVARQPEGAQLLERRAGEHRQQGRVRVDDRPVGVGPEDALRQALEERAMARLALGERGERPLVRDDQHAERAQRLEHGREDVTPGRELRDGPHEGIVELVYSPEHEREGGEPRAESGSLGAVERQARRDGGRAENDERRQRQGEERKLERERDRDPRERSEKGEPDPPRQGATGERDGPAQEERGRGERGRLLERAKD